VASRFVSSVARKNRHLIMFTGLFVTMKKYNVLQNVLWICGIKYALDKIVNWWHCGA